MKKIFLILLLIVTQTIASNMETNNNVPNYEPIFITPSELFINENSVEILQLVGHDSENDTIEFFIVGGEDKEQFILSKSGKLRFISAKNYESPQDKDKNNRYEIKIQMNDGNQLSDISSFTIVLRDINELPNLLIPSNITIVENTTDVLELISIDAEHSEVFYELLGEDNSSFFVNSQTNRIEQITPLDYENPLDNDKDNIYNITVRVSEVNDVTTFSQKDIRITVINQEEKPYLLNGLEYNVNENNKTVPLSFHDPEDDSMLLAIEGGVDKEHFEINDNKLFFITSPDYETKMDENKDNRYEVIIKISEEYNELFSNIYTLQIHIKDVNEMPKYLLGLNNKYLTEDSKSNYVIKIDDPEKQNLVLNIESNDTSLVDVVNEWNNTFSYDEYNNSFIYYSLVGKENQFGQATIQLSLDDGMQVNYASFKLDVIVRDDPLIDDEDGDGIKDWHEGASTLDDYDNDGIPDFRDRDSNNDGIDDIDTDGDTIGDYRDKDIDGDGISNIIEGDGNEDNDSKQNKLDLDSDNDGILDSIEGSNDLDFDGKGNFIDIDSDGDGKLDKDEGLGDDDKDGIVNYLDYNDNGSNGFIDKNDGTQYFTLKKVSKLGEDTTTTIQIPKGVPENIRDDNITTISISDPNSIIHIDEDGNLKLELNYGNEEQNITINTPGTDIIYYDNNHISLIIPKRIIRDTRCEYIIDIFVIDEYMQTTHYQNKNKQNEIKTQVISHLPSTSIDISKDYKVFYKSLYEKDNAKSYITNRVDCFGYVQNSLQILDENQSYIAHPIGGSITTVDANGDVVLTNSYDISSNILIKVDAKINRNDGNITVEYSTKDKELQRRIDYKTESFGINSHIIINKKNTEHVTLEKEIRKVGVIVNESGTKTKSQTIIDNQIDTHSFSIERQSDNYLINKNTSDTKIVINNYFNGQTYNSVGVNNTTTQLNSLIVGTKTILDTKGIDNEHILDSDTKYNIHIDNNGVLQQQIYTNDSLTQTTIQKSGAKSFIVQTGNEKMLYTYLEEVYNEKELSIEIEGYKDGTTAQFIQSKEYESLVTSKLEGLKSTLEETHINNTIEFSPNDTLDIVMYYDGSIALEKSTLNKVTSIYSKSTSNEVIINEDKSVTINVNTKNSMCDGNRYYTVPSVTIASDSETLMKVLNCNNEVSVDVDKTFDESNVLPKNAQVNVEKVNGGYEIEIDTPIEDEIRF